MIEIAAFTDRGKVRKRNEDALVVGQWVCQSQYGATVLLRSRAPLVAAVADGLGGHPDGDVASRLAAAEIGAMSPWWETPQDITRSLGAVHRTVRAEGERRGGRMGTTIAGLHIGEHALHVFNVGDSAVYRVRADAMELLSTDDSYRDAQGLPTHSLRQAVGTRDKPPTAHIRELPAAQGRFLVCSDGVSSYLGAEALLHSCAVPDLVDAAEALLAAVSSVGAPDNYSLLLVQLP
jgi:serine/threonine protein phosphatase PrpC